MLAQFLQDHKPVFVLTGAGISTASGIPDYRDQNGEWKHKKPINYQEFLKNERKRKRYWLRSMNGWQYINSAKPNVTHIAIQQMEKMGLLSTVVTQNVDGLHQHAGSDNVIDLHGNLHSVRCLDCQKLYPRNVIQDFLEKNNPGFVSSVSEIRPDGDVSMERHDLDEFHLPYCESCHGILKPEVVFFGESVPKERKNKAIQKLVKSRGMLVVGSSLMVYSGYRFCKIAQQHNIPIASVNQGITRADGEFLFKLDTECGDTLKAAVSTLHSA